MSSMIQEQATFLLHVSELIRKAAELGFMTSGGELFRTPEQQALHVKNGRSTTMNSQHLKRLAVDLNFFKPDAAGEPRLTYDVEELRPLGKYWESLDVANRWGGNWNTFKDTPHFERREGRAGGATPATTPATPLLQARDTVAPGASVAMAGHVAGPALGQGLLLAQVGFRAANKRDDVESVQRLLNVSAQAGRVQLAEGKLKPDGAFGNKTLDAIMAFQRSVLGEPTPSGLIQPGDACLRSLCEPLAGLGMDALLGLAYLAAGDEQIAALAAGLQQTMAARQIDTPLRRAHFLAQVGCESGELRFMEEIASGQAYEGRRDLGNTQPGDGMRFKGRGLIQLTGRANYAEYGRAIGREAELLGQPELVASDKALCADVAGWYWAKRELNALADRDDLTGITRRVNGGLNGLEERRRLLLRAKALLGA